MNEDHKRIFLDDLSETKGPRRREVSVRLVYYFFQRWIADAVLRLRLRRFFSRTDSAAEIDRFLWNEGGMFKRYAYWICGRMKPIVGATVLVPGVGYGRNILQLAALKPKKIVAFDLYAYHDDWEFLRKMAKEKFGVDIEFLKGDFPIVPRNMLGSFDLVISDAVLEHVRDLGEFARSAYGFLKPGGVFYASYGPLWYGPGGDHIDWGDGRDLYRHIVFPEAEYGEAVRQLAAKGQPADFDSCVNCCMAEEGLFSYLNISEYFGHLKTAGFRKGKCFAKISSRAVAALRDSALQAELDRKGVPLMDRICGGMYVWLRK